MNLFNPKTLRRYMQAVQAIPPEHLQVLENWRELIESGRIKNHKETGFHGEFKSRIVESVLGYTGPAVSREYTVSQEQSVLKGSVDLALGNFGGTTDRILAPFELKDANTDLDAIMPGRAKSPVQQAWEYAVRVPGVKWVLVSNYVEIRLYGFGEGTQACESFDLSRLTEPAEYARFMLLLGAGNLLSGKTAGLLGDSRREDRDITDKLYTDYKELRGTLVFEIRQQLPGLGPLPDLGPLAAIAAAQKILDRILFTAFAEDNDLLPNNILDSAYTQSNRFNPQPVWDNFKGLFAAINSGNTKLEVPPYNGGLFATDPLLDRLSIPDSICEKFRDIGAHDFGSEISVTILGHIFEQSITDIERLQAVARGDADEPAKKTGTTGRRKRDGVVYTPDYVARFIVEQTAGTHLKEIFADIIRRFAQKGADPDNYEKIRWKKKSAELEAWEKYRERLKTLRIVDPACGSGVFLVMAFDYMKAELLRVNKKIKDLLPVPEHHGDLPDYVPDSEILTNNLFGVDVNAESVEITKLSLWVKTARKGKPLDSLDKNFKVGDSLIEDSSYAYRKYGFNWKQAFADVFAEGGFDIVLGNPPWVRQESLGTVKPWLKTRFEVYHGVADLYCYFFERGMRLLKPGGRLGYISSSTFFKTSSGKPLRNYLRSQAMIETVIDFGDKQVFGGVTTYPAILTMRRGKPDPDHELRFWKIDNLPETNFRASFASHAQACPQSALSDGSWELESPALRTLRDKITSGRKTLKEVYGSPSYGIKTGRNEAFVIDEATRNRLVAKDPKSAEVLKPFLEGKDLKRWRTESRNLWLIFTRRGIDIDQYPAIKKYLEQYREILEPKPKNWKPNPANQKWKGRKGGAYKWYEIQDAVDYYEAFDKPKITYPHFSQGRKFLYDNSGFYSNDKTYVHNSPKRELLALLNSTVAWYFFRSICSAMKGGQWRLELRVQYVETLPVPDAADAQKSELAALAEACQAAAGARYALQQGLTRRIPDLARPGATPKLTTKLKTWWDLPDFAAFRKEVKKALKADIPLADRNDWEDRLDRDRAEIARLTAEIRACEDRINALVYTLFDLTPEDINLLEANL